MWKEYINKSKGRKVDPLLVEAVLIAPKGKALDLGAGAMHESEYLQQHGYDVTAIDSEPSITHPHIPVIHTRFEDFAFDNGPYALINARYSLPFSGKDSFREMFGRLRNSLKGIFVGQFFGPNDDWAGKEGIATHSRDEILELLEGMEIVKIVEEESERPTLSGELKHWHVFNVIARKE